MICSFSFSPVFFVISFYLFRWRWCMCCFQCFYQLFTALIRLCTTVHLLSPPRTMMLLVLRVPVLSRDSHSFCVVSCLCLTKACSNSCLLLLFCLLISGDQSYSLITVHFSAYAFSHSATNCKLSCRNWLFFFILIFVHDCNTTLVSLSNKHDSLQLTTCSA